MVEGGMKCIRYLIFAFNLIFVLAALALIVVGALVQTTFHDYWEFFGNQFNAAAIVLIVVGCVIFIIAFLGCCGAYKENYACTMAFAILLAIIFILEIAAGITGFVMRNKLSDQVQTILFDSEARYSDSSTKGAKKAWDTLQIEFKCCGVRNATEWPPLLNGSYPYSCCNLTTPDVDCLKQPNPVLWNQGCEVSFNDFLQDNIYYIGAVAIGLAFIQIIGIVFACCLARTIKKEYEVV